MAATFKALSALLSYPSAELQAAVPEIAAALDFEGLLAPEIRIALAPLLAELRAGDLFAVQERYVDLFDRGRQLSLHLFEHVHGESRDRGQAMVDLAALYERGGMTISSGELPDFLPLFLEYLATRPLEEALGELANTAPILEALGERLAARDAGYAAVIAALAALAGGRSAFDVAPMPENRAEELAALDAAWEEAAVTFGPGDAANGCSVDRLRTQMRAGARDVRRGTARQDLAGH